MLWERGDSEYIVPWAPTSIRRFVKAIATGTNVVVVETDVGEEYLKACGNPAGPHALACEWIGSNLARRLGLRTFEFALVAVSEDDEIPFASGGYAVPGPAFITKTEQGAPWSGTDQQLELLANPEDIARLIVLDTWTRNCDRHPADLALRRPNRDNVFLSREGAPANRLILKAIDHTHVFTCGRELTIDLAGIDHVQDSGIYGLFPEFWPYLQRRDVEAALQDLSTVGRMELQALVETIPVEWEVNEGARNALVAFLCDRAVFVAATLTSSMWPQTELPL